MVRRVIVSVACVIGAAVAPLSAELKYTQHLEAHPSPVPVTPDPIMGMMAGVIIAQMLPEGAVDMFVTVGDKGMRTECSKACNGMPAGGVMVQRPDGSTVVMMPADKTYWKLAAIDAGAAMALASMKPEVKLTPAGEGTVAGLKTTHSTLDMRIPLPMPEGMQPPPGFPTQILMTGDVWVTDKYAAFTKVVKSLAGPLASWLDKVAVEGFTMRTTLRGGPFGDQELEGVVTKIGEEPVPATQFEIPTDYKEIAAPRTGGGDRE